MLRPNTLTDGEPYTKSSPNTTNPDPIKAALADLDLAGESNLAPVQEYLQLGSTEDLPAAVKAIAERKLAEARRLLEQEGDCQLQIGKICWELTDDTQCGIKQSVVAKRLDRSESTISRYIAIYKASLTVDCAGVPNETLATVVRCAKRVESRVRKSYPTIEFKVDLQKGLDEIQRLGLTKSNDIIVHFRDQARAALAPQLLKATEAVVATIGGEILDRCHHCDYRELAKRIAPGSVHGIFADVPYGSYAHTSPLSHDMAGLTDCDFDSSEGALEVTCDLFPIAAILLAKDSPLVLFQASSALRAPIAKAAEDAGFVSHPVVVWDKGKVSPGWPEAAFGYRTEFAYIFTRVGEQCINHDGSDRDNLIAFAPVQHDRCSILLTHAYEKPAALMEFLVSKLTPPGGVVADFFACSGSCSLAARKLGRRWIYCESNQGNYDLGVSRLAPEIPPAPPSAADQPDAPEVPPAPVAGEALTPLAADVPATDDIIIDEPDPVIDDSLAL